MITVSGISKWYGRTRVLDGVSLQVDAGTSVALAGPNGAGKTTILLCMLGLVHFTGSIVVDGHDVRHRGKEARQRIGYVPQLPTFFERLTVLQSLLLSAELRRLRPDRVSEVMDLTEISSQGDVRIQALSGGTRQRLALATALLADPPILLLDEPTSHLDDRARLTTARLLRSLRESGRTLVIASHDPADSAVIADRVVQMEDGRVVSQRASRPSGADTTLHLLLAPSDVARALTALRAGGHHARSNGRGVLLQVAPEDKAPAISILLGAGIEIQDVQP